MVDYHLQIRDLPIHLLTSELQRRQDQASPVYEAPPVCGSGVRGSYNTPAHVFALFLILSLSLAACALPLITKRASTGPSPFIFYSQHFGSGVLIATAFVHLLPTAFISLTDPCLTGVWKSYKPMAGLIAMMSALAVVAIEMALRGGGVAHKHSHGEWNAINSEDLGGGIHAMASKERKSTRKNGKPRDEDMDGLVENAAAFHDSSPTTITTNGHAKYNTTKNDDFASDAEDSDLDLEDLDLQSLDPRTAGHTHADFTNDPESDLTLETRRKKLLQCLLLEAGILFHSIFIGMAISVATGPPFIIFLIAIAFHQSFEGIALGTRIAALAFPASSPRPWLMVLAYGITTPFGQAIGLGVHKLYDPQSEAGLLMVGVMNGVSSGLLLFAGLVQLLAEDFLSDHSYEVLHGRRRWKAYGAVVGGAFLMALVGAWA